MEELVELKKIHDEIKDHPYWLNFDDKFLGDLIKMFLRLSRTFKGKLDKTNPYRVIISCVTHDFNCMLGNISYWVKDNRWNERKGDVIAVLQTYLANIHRLIDKKDFDETVVGYTLGYTQNKAALRKFKAFLQDDGTYKIYNIVDEKAKSVIRKDLEKYASLKNNEYMKSWAIEGLKDLDEGRDIIADCWKIEN